MTESQVKKINEIMRDYNAVVDFERKIKGFIDNDGYITMFTLSAPLLQKLEFCAPPFVNGILAKALREMHTEAESEIAKAEQYINNITIKIPNEDGH